MDCKAPDKDDPSVGPRFGKVGHGTGNGPHMNRPRAGWCRGEVEGALCRETGGIPPFSLSHGLELVPELGPVGFG